MKTCEQWAVAAVYLLEHGTAHYREVTEYVLSTNLTTLDNSEDPEATIRSILSTQKLDGDVVFYSYTRDCPDSKGVWELNIDEDVIRKAEAVQNVLRCLSEPKADFNTDTLRCENERLRQENQQLKEKLKSIKQLCDEG